MHIPSGTVKTSSIEDPTFGMTRLGGGFRMGTDHPKRFRGDGEEPIGEGYLLEFCWSSTENHLLTIDNTVSKDPKKTTMYVEVIH